MCFKLLFEFPVEDYVKNMYYKIGQNCVSLLFEHEKRRKNIRKMLRRNDEEEKRKSSKNDVKIYDWGCSGCILFHQ